MVTFPDDRLIFVDRFGAVLADIVLGSRNIVLVLEDVDLLSVDEEYVVVDYERQTVVSVGAFELAENLKAFVEFALAAPGCPFGSLVGIDDEQADLLKMRL